MLTTYTDDQTIKYKRLTDPSCATGLNSVKYLSTRTKRWESFQTAVGRNLKNRKIRHLYIAFPPISFLPGACFTRRPIFNTNQFEHFIWLITSHLSLIVSTSVQWLTVKQPNMQQFFAPLLDRQCTCQRYNSASSSVCNKSFSKRMPK